MSEFPPRKASLPKVIAENRENILQLHPLRLTRPEGLPRLVVLGDRVVLLVLVQLVQPLDDRRRRDELHRAAVRKQLPHENHHLAHQLKGFV